MAQRVPTHLACVPTIFSARSSSSEKSASTRSRQDPLHESPARPLALALSLITQPAFAERTDRQQPVNIEADHMTVDDRNKVHVFEGNVILTQGSLLIKGDKLVVTQDAAGFQNGVATASDSKLATFRPESAKPPANTSMVKPSASNTTVAARRRACSIRPVSPAAATKCVAPILNTTRSLRYLATNAPSSKPAAGSDTRTRSDPAQERGQGRPSAITSFHCNPPGF